MESGLIHEKRRRARGRGGVGCRGVYWEMAFRLYWI
jgi:hypothetical protein